MAGQTLEEKLPEKSGVNGASLVAAVACEGAVRVQVRGGEQLLQLALLRGSGSPDELLLESVVGVVAGG